MEGQRKGSRRYWIARSQSVSPRRTTWSAAVSPAAAAAGRVAAVSAWAEAVAGASAASTTSTASRLERQIVFLIFQRSWEVLEVVGASRGGLRGLLRRGTAPARAAAALVERVLAAAAAAAEHDQLADVDLRAVPRLVV